MAAPYPFSAVVGLADLRLSLLLNAVSPAIGGVLVRGEKGTAKSTVVRALAGLLPMVEVVAGCRFACDPAAPYAGCPDAQRHEGVSRRPARLVELPVGATEDRLVGALDLERALTSGQAHYEPGLLAAAHRGVLYVDEVNLLHDHLVDLLLDAAAMGEAHVERDGVSVRHAARFLLVGTMNPEEGELRPQLLDRFGLAVEVTAPRAVEERVEVVRRRLAYEADPVGFAARWASAEAVLAGQIEAARDRLSKVDLPDAEVRRIAQVCAAFEVDGMRADIVVARTAIALAAWHERDVVSASDVRDAARLALPHRRRRNPFDAPQLDERALEEALNQGSPPSPEPSPDSSPDSSLDPSLDPSPDRGPSPDSELSPGPEPSPDPDPSPDLDPEPEPDPPAAMGDPAQGGPAGAGGAGGVGGSRTDPPREPHRARLFAVPGVGQGATGRRSPAYTQAGLTVAARPGSASLHLVATLRAAAPYQMIRERKEHGPVRLRKHDLREKVRRGREANLVLFCVDASGSMAARQRMGAVKAAVLSLLLDAYQRRDKVGLVTFRGDGAELALPPTSSVEAGAARLRSLPTGGRTPLGRGLAKAAETLRVERIRDPNRRPLLVVVTDGRATAGGDPGAAVAALAAMGVATVVVDCESGYVRLGLARALADRLGAQHVPLELVTAQELRSAVAWGRAA